MKRLKTIGENINKFDCSKGTYNDFKEYFLSLPKLNLLDTDAIEILDKINGENGSRIIRVNDDTCYNVVLVPYNPQGTFKLYKGSKMIAKSRSLNVLASKANMTLNKLLKIKNNKNKSVYKLDFTEKRA